MHAANERTITPDIMVAWERSLDIGSVVQVRFCRAWYSWEGLAKILKFNVNTVRVELLEDIKKRSMSRVYAKGYKLTVPTYTFGCGSEEFGKVQGPTPKWSDRNGIFPLEEYATRTTEVAGTDLLGGVL